MKLLVCGGRDYVDTSTAWSVLDFLHAQDKITNLIQGGANGADAIAKRWAELNGVPMTEVPADWNGYGRAAGPMRNMKMLELNPDRVLALPGGKGTANMVKQARHAGIPITEIA